MGGAVSTHSFALPAHVAKTHRALLFCVDSRCDARERVNAFISMFTMARQTTSKSNPCKIK
eukprot:1446506-Amphidinium_carterae.2